MQIPLAEPRDDGLSGPRLGRLDMCFWFLGVVPRYRSRRRSAFCVSAVVIPCYLGLLVFSFYVNVSVCAPGEDVKFIVVIIGGVAQLFRRIGTMYFVVKHRNRVERDCESGLDFKASVLFSTAQVCLIGNCLIASFLVDAGSAWIVWIACLISALYDYVMLLLVAHSGEKLLENLEAFKIELGNDSLRSCADGAAAYNRLEDSMATENRGMGMDVTAISFSILLCTATCIWEILQAVVRLYGGKPEVHSTESLRQQLFLNLTVLMNNTGIATALLLPFMFWNSLLEDTMTRLRVTEENSRAATVILLAHLRKPCFFKVAGQSLTKELLKNLFTASLVSPCIAYAAKAILQHAN